MHGIRSTSGLRCEMRHLLLSSGEGVLRCVRRKADIPLRDAGAGSRGVDSRSLSAVRVLARHACHGRRDDGLCVDHGSPTCTPGSTRERSTSLRRPCIHATEGHHLKVSIYYNQYLRQLDGVDYMVHPPECSHLCNRLINKNRLWHFRKQF